MATQLRVSKFCTIGDDYLVINNVDGHFDEYRLNTRLKARLCDRYYGLGGNALIEMRSHPTRAYEAVNHQAIGIIGHGCGNGSRSTVLCAKLQGLFPKGSNSINFVSHEGERVGFYNPEQGTVKVNMKDVTEITQYNENEYLLDSGTYHYVRFIDEDVKKINVVEEGRKISLRPEYAQLDAIVIVDFVQIGDDGKIHVRCYDRGAQDSEIVACGTGTIASAVAYSLRSGLPEGEQKITINWPNGTHDVSLTRRGMMEFTSLFFEGPITHVLDAIIDPEHYLQDAYIMGNSVLEQRG